MQCKEIYGKLCAASKIENLKTIERDRIQRYWSYLKKCKIRYQEACHYIFLEKMRTSFCWGITK